jgi:poly(3-hydroxyalkanoate) synthetase
MEINVSTNAILSSTEAEYVALHNTVREGKYMSQVFHLMKKQSLKHQSCIFVKKQDLRKENVAHRSELSFLCVK